MQLIVLGMHRSGTSSVTRLLNLGGAYFGPEGMATDANEENPKGFWERRDVRAVCDGLLLGGGYDWWRVADFDPERIPAEVREEQLEAFRRIVLQLDAHRPWVLKEPRLCLLLPLLRPVLEAPVLVHVTRDPLEIASSLATRNGFPVPTGLALWEAYTLGAVVASAGETSVEVSYAALMEDPVATTRALVERLGELGIQGLRTPSDREITAFVAPSLHRQHRAPAERAGYLNATQLVIAEAADERRLLSLEPVPALSAGATDVLRAFEDRQSLAADLMEAGAERIRVEDAHQTERIRVEDAHQTELDRLAAQQQAADAARLAAAADEARAAINEARAAIESLGRATRHLDAVKASGAVRLGARLSKVRERVQGGSTIGIQGALARALSEVDDVRTTLGEHVEDRGSFELGDGADPPTAGAQRQARRTARAGGARTKVAVVAWDVGHNPFGRAHLLADLLRDQYDVELWGSQFERYGTDVWPPLRGTTIPVKRLPGASFPEFLDTLEDAARWIDADAIWVSKPRLPSLALGILAKERWNRPLIVDIDDFEPSFFDEADGLPLDELLRHRQDADLALPFGRLWTQACEPVIHHADRVTVSNPELEARYGGLLVPHARDEAVFDPARHDREAARSRLGLGTDDRLVLFGGTPRAHKGIIDLLEALETLGDAHLRLGVFATRELDGLRAEIGSLERWIHPLPYHAFDDLPGLLAAVDLTCALQAPGHPVSRYQMPAKVTDAMAMGVPCLVTPVPPLMPLVDKDVVEVFDGDVPLAERIRQIFADRDATAHRAARAREVFLESYSYAAVRPIATAAIEGHLADPAPLATPMRSLIGTVRHLYRPDSSPPPADRAHLPAGTTYDLAIFWKQNDSGIYGRRQDMFLRYLQRSGRFRTIVHFDQPMSAEGLALVARRSVGSTDQNRLVLAQTLRRLARRGDHGSVRRRTFLYAAGSASRRLGLPRRDGYPAWVRAVLDREGVDGSRPLMCWVYPTNTDFPAVADLLRPDVVVADVVDDNRTWYATDTPARRLLERNYADILERSDVVLANCDPVAESMRAFAPQVDVVSNACEVREGEVRGPRPPELAGVGGPVVGYAGNLSDRIDIALLRELAQRRRDWTFVFLGSAHLDRSALDLAIEPNVRFLGTKRYDDARTYIAHFDVGLIPHVDNDMTRSMNPLKAYVYCSLGVPIVSTPIANIGEMAEFITVAEGPDAFIAAIEAALAAGRSEPDADRLRPHSWNERVERVLGLVDAVTATRLEGPG